MVIKTFFKLLLLFFLTAFFCSTIFNHAQAEIIDIQNEEKTFGDWKVFCEVDAMMDIAHCKIGAKFYDNTAVINIEPATNFLNQFFIVIPQVKIGSFIKIRIDKNDLVLSQNVTTKNFGLIPLDDNQKNILYQQMNLGNFLFLRFNIQGLDKEITARISLKDFRNALEYYNSRISKNLSAI